MATGEQMARGLQIAHEVQEEYPHLTARQRRPIVAARWKAIERQVAQLKRRPR